MFLVQAMIDRLYGVPLPPNLCFRITNVEYPILGITMAGIRYRYGPEGNTREATLTPSNSGDLFMKDFKRESGKKVTRGPKYIIEATFNFRG